MVEKSRQKHDHTLTYVFPKRKEFLENLHTTICDDERIRLKIEHEWDVLRNFKARQMDLYP